MRAQSTATAPPQIQPSGLGNQQSSDGSLEEAARLNQEADDLNDHGRYEAAIPLAERSLSIREKTLAAGHPNIGRILSTLGVAYYLKRDYTRSASIFERALVIAEKSFGTEPQTVAIALNNLAQAYRDNGDFARATPLFERALAINETLPGRPHPDVGRVLNNLAVLYQRQSNYEQAEPRFKRALDIAEAKLGTESHEAGIVLNNLGQLYVKMGDFKRPEPLYQRALAIRETHASLGYQDETGVAEVLNNLAELYKERGDYTRAESYLKRSLTIIEKVRGPDHPAFASALGSLAVVDQARGDYASAEALMRQSLRIREKALGNDHPDVAQALNNLAALYQDQGDFALIEPLYLRSLEIYEKKFGADHPDVARMLNNLGSYYERKGNYSEAEARYKRSLRISEKLLGPTHPDVATTLNNLALLYKAKKDYALAEQTLRRSLRIYEQALGAVHPDVATVLYNLASLYEAKGSVASAIQFMTRAAEVQEQNLALILDTGSEHQKQLYMATLADNTDNTVSLHLNLAPNNPDALRLALTTVLRRKGRALDAMADHVGALRRRLNPQDRGLLDQLSATRAQLSALVFKGVGQAEPAQHRANIARLEAEAERLEAQVSVRSAEFFVEAQPTTIEHVQQALPVQAALVEIISYRPFEPKGETFGKQHYAAYVLRRKGAPLFLDLGEAEPINRGVGRLRVALSDAESLDARESGRALDKLVMSPLRRLLPNARQLLISPDGALNLVPFDALVDELNRYLIERYSITYLTSGRDLRRIEAESASRAGMVVIANPLFELGPRASQPEITSAASPNISAGTLPQEAPITDSAPGRRSVDLSTGIFSPLSGTAQEAQAIAAIFPEVKALTQAAATESRLKQVGAPSILHIATHGFFLRDQPEKLPGNDPGMGRSVASGRRAVGGENPLLRSGLVLAGANQRNGGDGEDGILTALEASGLDLWGTKLVVLSACQTGVGEIKNGEGVYGLRRALVLAGAESELMSLWRVDDAATSDLMVAYYKRLKAGAGRTEALRLGQLQMLRSKDRRHPYFWASFIPIGDWRNLDGK